MDDNDSDCIAVRNAEEFVKAANRVFDELMCDDFTIDPVNGTEYGFFLAENGVMVAETTEGDDYAHAVFPTVEECIEGFIVNGRRMSETMFPTRIHIPVNN